MGTYTDTHPTPLDMTGWSTVFFDGFNGTQLDWQKWPITYGGSMYWNNAFYWDGNQVTVGNGELTIGLDKQANGIWSVGGLTTMAYDGAPAGHGHDFTYGRVEIRAKTSAEVVGAGPCFLLWPSDNVWPPEIDILETPANGQGMFTNHWQGPGGANDDWYKSHFFDLDHSQWHTYTLDWLPNRLTLYVDGVKVAETTENIPHIPMSVGLQGHVGTAWDGWYGSPNSSGVNSVDISVDWVRVSQYTGGAAPQPPQPPVFTVPGLTLTGTAAGDSLAGSTKADSISGGAGGDSISGNAGGDTLGGDDGHDTMRAGTGDDILRGGAGNDVLRGEAGNDTVTTGAGIDRVLWGKGDGADRVTDFTLGSDRIGLAGATADQVTAAVVTDGGISGLKLTLGSGETLFLEGLGMATAKQLGIAGVFRAASAPSGLNVTGTAGDDWLKGGAAGDTLSGGAGSDDLQGLDGNDLLRGGKGHDGLTGGGGVDTFVFARGDGADWIVDFQPGVEKLRLEGITAGQVVQTVETRWGMTGLELAFGNGDEVFLQGVGARLAAGDLVFG